MTEALLILGASISWGCVSTCEPVQTEPGYVERLRKLLPGAQIHVRAWFSSGVLDWEPGSPSIRDQELPWPAGVWEHGTDERRNLWHLLGKDAFRPQRPRYTFIMLGIGDWLRPLRGGGLPSATPSEYEVALRRLARMIRWHGSTPVLVVDSGVGVGHPSGILWDYAERLALVCQEPGNLCGPNLLEVTDPVAHFVGTDTIHPNADGHQAIAEAFAEWLARH